MKTEDNKLRDNIVALLKLQESLGEKILSKLEYLVTHEQSNVRLAEASISGSCKTLPPSMLS